MRPALADAAAREAPFDTTTLTRNLINAKAHRSRVHLARRSDPGARRQGRGPGWRIRAGRLDPSLLARRDRRDVRYAHAGRRRIPPRPAHVRDARRGVRADAE